VTESPGLAPGSTPAARFDLSGKVAVVTGGSRGLGRAIALGLAGAGADVVVASRKLEACEEVAEAIRAMGRRALAVACHVGHWDELATLADRAHEELGEVDVLVNNAGMSPVYGDLEEVTEALWDKVLDVNLKGVFRLTTLLGTRMKQRGRGSVVNLSSTGAIRPTPWIIPYAAAKAGVDAMTVGFAHALGPEVRVNCIMPGPFLTDVTRGWDLEAFAEAARRFALRRGGRPEEVVGAALYLASDASSFTTGAVIRVDGGIP
jgi:NAD(P)-dependent dehydrogenase (short-subunit alcohol dehydrogenase family)